MEIVHIARSYGLFPHLTTNGIRFANEEYAKKICEERIPMRFALDGLTPEVYARMRDDPGACEKKLKGLANLSETLA